MAAQCIDLVEKFPELLRSMAGDAKTVITGPCSSETPVEGGICYCRDEEELGRAIKANVAAVVTSTHLFEKHYQPSVKQHWFVTPNLQLAMAKVNAEFFPVTVNREPFDGHKIHPTAVIAKTAKIGSNVIIGPNTVIGANVEIGADCVIGSNTTIEPNVQIGAGCHIHSQVFIAHGVQLGDRCIVKPQSALGTDGYGYAQDQYGNHFKKPHYGRLVIGNDVHIGCGTFIDRGTFEDSVIGDGTKIDNYCHLGHNIRIGKNCLVTAGMITAGSATIGDNCVFGGRTTVAGHLTVTSGVQAAGLSAIHKGVTKPGRYGGYPFVPLNESMKILSTTVHLPKMRKQISMILKKLGIEENDQ